MILFFLTYYQYLPSVHSQWESKNMTTFVVTLENPNKRAFIKPDLVPVRSKCTLSIL